jgi:hypothetical protein
MTQWLRRTVSLGLIAIGWACLWSSLERDMIADECQPSEYSPATCIPAHEESSENASSGMGCYVNEMGECVPGENGCGGDIGFGIAVEGSCELQPAGSNPCLCTADYGLTVVELHRWQASCEVQEGVCTCAVEADAAGRTSDVQVCTCRDEAL